MEDRIAVAEMESPDMVKQARECVKIVFETILELREYILANPFNDAKNEIEFYKETEPRFYSHLIYYNRIYKIMTGKPVGSIKQQKKYLRRHLKKITHYFNSNIEFYQYYRSGATHLDESFYLANKFDILYNIDDYSLIIDPRFSTTHSYKKAKIEANERLRVFILSEIEKLKADNLTVEAEDSVTWVASKVAFVELIYSIIAVKAVNTDSIKVFAAYMCKVFNIKIDNIYRINLENRERKKTVTPFLDKMKASLINLYEVADKKFFN